MPVRRESVEAAAGLSLVHWTEPNLNGTNPSVIDLVSSLGHMGRKMDFAFAFFSW